MPARRPLVVLALVLGAIGSAVPSGAHTQVQRATPGPGESVEGDVDAVVLDFLDPVMPTPQISVTGPDGPVAGLGQPRLTADDVVRVEFDPLTAAGDYQVDYTYTALDGAAQQGAHQFSFRPARGDLAARPVLAAIVGAVVAVALASAVIGRRRSRP